MHEEPSGGRIELLKCPVSITYLALVDPVVSNEEGSGAGVGFCDGVANGLHTRQLYTCIELSWEVLLSAAGLYSLSPHTNLLSTGLRDP